MVSGAGCVAYWAATYSWDMIIYAATVAITMLVFVAYQDQSFIGSPTKAGAAVLLLMSFGASVIPLTYCYSFGFSNHANAQVYNHNTCIFPSEFQEDYLLPIRRSM